MDNGSLVSQVKDIQRSGLQAKQMWGDYADTHLGGMRDPSRHDANTLSHFVNSYNSGSLPQPSVAQGKGGGGSFGKGGMGGKGMKGGMQDMMSAMMGTATGGVADSSEFIKTGQRTSPSFKVSWQAYCITHGTGKADPRGYDRDFIAGFIEYIGLLGSKELGAEGVLGAEAIEACTAGQKRPVPFAGGTTKRHCTADNLDPEKADLVNRVKNVQRTAENGKEAWSNFCDTNCAGVRDPAKNDNEALQRFLLEVGA